MKKLIGTCSRCGGNVFENFGEQLMGAEQPISCNRGGATRPTNLPVIEMNESKQQLLQENV